MALMDTTEMSAIIQDVYQEAVDELNITPSVFWPGSPGASLMEVDDRTTGEGGDGRLGIYNGLVAYDVAEGQPHNVLQSFKPTFSTLTSSEKITYAEITDPAQRKMTSPNAMRSHIAGMIRAAIRAHAKKFDDAVFLLAESMQIGATDTTNAIVMADVLTAIGVLQTNDVPEPWLGFISPMMWQDLLAESSSSFLDESKSGGVASDVWKDYTTKRFLGVDWVVTSRVRTDGTDDWGFLMSAAPDHSPLGAIFYQMPFAIPVRDENKRTTEFNFVSDWGVGLIDQASSVADATGFYLRFDAP